VTVDIRVHGSAEELAEAVAGLFASVAMEDAGSKGSFIAALSGGSTPVAAYRVLALERYASTLPWDSTHIFWGDERCVAPEHPDSNFGAAKGALLSKVPIPETNIHRIKGELPPEEAAAAYEAELMDVFERFGRVRGGMPRFDLVLLGLGTDGHTLSIFPGSPAMEESERLIKESYVESLDSWRLTMTMPVVNNARRAVFVVSGRQKADVLARVLSGDSPELPASLVSPTDGTLTWMVDADAAALL